MTDAVVRRDACRLCGGRDVELVIPIAATPVGDAYLPHERRDAPQPTYPCDLYLCRGCGHVQLLDVVDPNLLYGDYTYHTSVSLGLPEHFAASVDRILRLAQPPPGALAIDIGSNDGTFLRAFQRRGMQAYGVDPAPALAQRAREAGVETRCAFFTADLARRIRQERGPASIATANNTLANVDDVDDVTQGVRELLAPDGVFVFETGYLADLIQRDLIDTIYHEHLSYFAVRPLEAFFRRHGLELIEAERILTKGGSLRGIVQLAGGPRAVSPSVGELGAVEARLGLHQPPALKAFGERMESLKRRLADQLGRLRREGKTVAGYGASVGVTTLLYHFELDEFIGALYDDNPIKHHTFSPGMRLPVFPSQALYEHRPDCVVLLAWRYAEPIIGRHGAFLDGGGQFIIPLPTLRLHGRPAHVLNKEEVAR